jgi:hypothetical protein
MIRTDFFKDFIFVCFAKICHRFDLKLFFPCLWRRE